MPLHLHKIYQTPCRLGLDMRGRVLAFHSKIKPVPDVGRTAFGWTMESETAAAIAPDINLPPGENTVADHARSFIVERVPESIRISRAQDGKTLIEIEPRFHA